MDDRVLTRLLEKRPAFFTVMKGVFSLAMNKSMVFENPEHGISFTIIELSDGKYWIPAVVPDQALNEALKAHGEDFRSMMETLQGTNVILTEVMVGVYKRGSWYAPHLIVHKCEITNMAAPMLPRPPHDICFLPGVTKWLIDLQKEIPKDNSEWYTALFPKSKKSSGYKSDIIEIYEVVEYVLVQQYDELPPLDQIELPSKTAKRKNSDSDVDDRPKKHNKQEHEEQEKPDENQKLTQSVIVDIWQDLVNVSAIDCKIPKAQQASLDAQYGSIETPTSDNTSPPATKALETAMDTANPKRSETTAVQGDTAPYNSVISDAVVNKVDDQEDELEESESIDPSLYWEKKYASYVDMVGGFQSKLRFLLYK